MSTLKANRIENLTTTDGGININNSGNVGIGTTSPGDVLTVAGTNAFIKVDRSNGNPGIDFRYDGSTTNRGVIDVTSAGALRIAAGGNTERLRIDSSGRVGIGTSAPDTKVHVVGSLKVENTSGTGNAWTYYKNADRTYLVGVRGSGSDALSFYDLTADVERMRIDTSGRVGIGTSSPSFELQVSQSGSASEIAATSNVTSGTASRLLLGNSVGTARATFNLTGGGSELAYLGTEGNFPMYFQTNGAERMRIDSSGRVGIGTSSPGNPLHIADQNPSIRLQSNSGSYQGRNTLGQYNNVLYIECDNDNAISNSIMAFTVDSQEKMRINSSGTVCINRPDSVVGTNKLALSGDGSNTIVGVQTGSTTATVNFAQFFDGSGTSCGGIAVNGTTNTTSYITTSDYRLKENIVDITGAIARFNNLAPKRFNFIDDETQTTLDGFIAHEVQIVVPEAVVGDHNEVDDDDNPVYQGIDQSKLVPLLTAALQEAIAKIETLETKVAALEAAE